MGSESRTGLSDGGSARGPESATVIDGVDPLVGQTLSGNYVVEARLGEGGMGAVYKGRHVRLPKAVAIKLVRTDLDDPSAVARFRQEAEVAAQVGSEHIAAVFDFNTLPDGTPYLVMDLLEGEDLEARLKKRGGRLSISETRLIVEQVVEGLSAAHAKGVVHRDLKPANIFLCTAPGKRDFVKILDFGLSKVVGSSRALTSANIAVGTPDYMSPEQCLGEASLDHRSDIYSLGAMLYELLTGSTPFTGEVAQMLTRIVSDERPKPMRTLAPHLPSALDDVVLRALEKDPAARPQTVEELWDQVNRALDASSLSTAWRAVPAGMSGSDVEATMPDSRTTIEVRRRSGRSRIPMILAGLGALALGLLGAWLAFKR